MVSPENYRRAKNLTVNMIQIKELQKFLEKKFGDPKILIERRHASVSEIPPYAYVYKFGNIGNGDDLLFDLDVKTMDVSKVRALEMNVEEFIEFLRRKRPSKLEIYVDETVENNVCYLIGPKNEDVPLFKHGDGYCLVYRGGFADARIVERLEKYGGKIEGYLRISLIWWNYDDLGIHVLEPGGGHIYYGDRKGYSGGELDIDMNANDSVMSREPVENIIWEDEVGIDGWYVVYVHNYRKREKIDVGFKVEFVSEDGHYFLYEYKDDIGHKERIDICKFRVENGRVVEVKHILEPSMVSDGLLKKGKWYNVSLIWQFPFNGEGFTHLLFSVDGLEPKDGEKVPGFLVEYFPSEFRRFRKVLEAISRKYLVDVSKDGVISIGFTKGREQCALFRVDGRRVVRVRF